MVLQQASRGCGWCLLVVVGGWGDGAGSLRPAGYLLNLTNAGAQSYPPREDNYKPTSSIPARALLQWRRVQLKYYVRRGTLVRQRPAASALPRQRPAVLFKFMLAA